jgi:hypothetical protein
MGPTPLFPPPAENIVPKGAPISDNDSVVSSVYSQHSEPEGEFRDDDDYNGFVHIPQPPLAPNIVNEGAGPNLVPEGDKSIQAPEGAAVPSAPNIGQQTCDLTCQYPPAKWI